MEEENIIELTAEDGKKYQFEILAYTKEQGEIYAILYPTFDSEDLYIVRVDGDPDSDTCSYTVVEDKDLIHKLYQRYKDSNPEGIDFQD